MGVNSFIKLVGFSVNFCQFIRNHRLIWNNCHHGAEVNFQTRMRISLQKDWSKIFWLLFCVSFDSESESLNVTLAGYSELEVSQVVFAIKKVMKKLENTFSLLNFSSEVVFRRWIVIMISGWLVLMWIWRLFVKIDERGSFLDNVDLNQEPLVLDTLPLFTKILQDVSQAPVRHPSGLSIKYSDCGRHYSFIFKEFMIWNKRNCTSLCP